MPGRESVPSGVTTNVVLAPYTTLGLGGPVRYFARADDDDTLVRRLDWAGRAGIPVLVLGGGSNVVVSDEGLDALALQPNQRGFELVHHGSDVLLTLGAGEPWDSAVERAVQRNLAGIECLSGIPGHAGATPIQNVGAYGQEIAGSLERVQVYDRTRGTIDAIERDDCGFGYRTSVFKRDPERWIVLAVTLRLREGGAPCLRYGELARALAGERSPSLARTREVVLSLRRTKSMVVGDPTDPNRRSVGSFFTNPVVSAALAERVLATADDGAAPYYPQPDGRVKLAAAWLIEHAGFSRGLDRGAFGISTRHSLALVHHGGGRMHELLALAHEIRGGVHERFGVQLEPEPVLWGARWPWDLC